MKAVTGEEDLMLITTGGVLIRIDVGGISVMGRNTQGVKLIRLEEDENEYVATVAKVEKEEEKEDDAVAEESSAIESEDKESTSVEHDEQE